MKIILGLIAVVSIVVLCTASDALPDDRIAPDVPEHYALRTADEAIEQALKYTGFDNLRGFDSSASVSNVRSGSMHDFTTPYICDSLESRLLWSVDFMNVVLELGKTKESREDSDALSFRVHLDSKTGQLVGVRFPAAGANDTTLRKVKGQDVINRFEAPFLENYLGMPSVLPEMTLTDVLGLFNQIKSRTIGLMVMNYIQYSGRNSECDSISCPAWIVTIYGNDIASGYERLVFDAMTGDRLSQMSYRRPE